MSLNISQFHITYKKLHILVAIPILHYIHFKELVSTPNQYIHNSYINASIGLSLIGTSYLATLFLQNLYKL